MLLHCESMRAYLSPYGITSNFHRSILRWIASLLFS